MTWQELLAAKRVKRHRTSLAELDELRAGVEVKLKDAELPALSADTRFVTAYGAALLLTKMAIACAGYRLDSKAGGHHKTAFEALPLAMGAEVEELSGYLDLCRRKRNEIDYDRAFVASDADAEELVRRTRQMQILVEEWIAANHSAFANRPEKAE